MSASSGKEDAGHCHEVRQLRRERVLQPGTLPRARFVADLFEMVSRESARLCFQGHNFRLLTTTSRGGVV